MPEPIQSTPDPPRLRFRLTMGGMMFVVAVIAVLLALWVATFRLMIDVTPLDLQRCWKVACMLLAETVVVYYVALAGILIGGFKRPAGLGRRPGRVLIFGPVLLIVLLWYFSVLLEMLARLPWI